MIPLDHVVIDNLHLFLWVTDVLIDQLIRNFWDWIHLSKAKKIAGLDWSKHIHIAALRTLSRRMAYQDYRTFVSVCTCAWYSHLNVAKVHCIYCSPVLLFPVFQGSKVALRHLVLCLTLCFGQWSQGSTGVRWLLPKESGVQWCLVLSIGHNCSELPNYCNDSIPCVACNGGLDAILAFGLSIQSM